MLIFILRATALVTVIRLADDGTIKQRGVRAPVSKQKDADFIESWGVATQF